MPVSWRAAQRPHHSSPCRPQLAAHTSAHPVQAVHTGLPERSGVRTELPAERHLPVASAESQRRLRSTSSADLIAPATQRTTMGDSAFTAPRA